VDVAKTDPVCPALLADYLTGRLPPAQMDAVEEYLRQHPEACSAWHDARPDNFTSAVRQAVMAAPPGADQIPSANAGAWTGGAAGAEDPEVPAELLDHPRYQVLRLLGKGGMGAVYLAEHKVMRRQVAIKVMSRRYVANSAMVDRFHREINAAARLHHPNIVTAHDAEQVGQTHFLAMEYVEGETLKDYLTRRQPLAIADACELIRQAALGLQHAHEKGMIHRDIKPQNLMRTPDGRVKILDFGLAALRLEEVPEYSATSETLPPDAAVTATGAVMGTADYIAPEQTQDASQVDIRADIYALGCTFFQLLTGRLPFEERGIREQLQAHREQEAPAVRSLRPEVPAALVAIVRRMLAKTPTDRYQTPAEAAEALRVFEPTAPRGQHYRFGGRLLWVAALLALMLPLAGFYLFRSEPADLSNTLVDSRRPKTDEGPAVESIHWEPNLPILKPKHKNDWKNHHSFVTRFSPDGKYYAATGGDETSQDGVRVWETATGNEVLRVGGSGWLAFTPDSRQVLVQTYYDCLIRAWDLQTREVVKIFQGNSKPSYSWEITPDGKTLVSTGEDRSVRFWAMETQQKIGGLPDVAKHPWIQMLPDGSILVADLHGEGVPIRRFAVPSGKLLKTWSPYRDERPFLQICVCSDGQSFLTRLPGESGLIFWQIDRPAPVREVRVGKAMAALGISGDFQWAIINPGYDSAAYLLNLRTRRAVARADLDHAALGCHDISSDGRHAVISTVGPSTVYLFEIPQ
jgi:serine/threonine protein kinase